MFLSSRKNDPGLLIETGSKSKHVLCIQSVFCPPPPSPPSIVQTTLQPVTTTPILELRTTQWNSNQTIQISGSKQLSYQSTEFWHVLLAGTEPKSWFLATIFLGCFCFILIIILSILGLYICRLKKFHRRRRCRGACRFGCRCSADVVRQTATNAAVFGPLETQTSQPYTHMLSSHGNGSIRSGIGLDNNVYTVNGNTLNSHRWGSNSQKLGSPLYVALNAASDKNSFLATGRCNTPNCILEDSSNVDLGNNLDGCSDAWSQRNNRNKPKRISHDGLHRSTSDVSNMSGSNEPNLKSTNTFMYRMINNKPHMSLAEIINTNLPTAMMVSNTSQVQSFQDQMGAIHYLSNSLNTYNNCSDSGRGSGISPIYSYSPTHLNSNIITSTTNAFPINNNVYMVHTNQNGINYGAIDNQTDKIDTQRYMSFGKVIPIIQTESYNTSTICEFGNL